MFTQPFPSPPARTDTLYLLLFNKKNQEYLHKKHPYAFHRSIIELFSNRNLFKRTKEFQDAQRTKNKGFKDDL